MSFVTLFSEFFASILVLLLIFWQLLLILLLVCSRPLVLILTFIYLKDFLQSLAYCCSFKFKLYGITKRCVTLLSLAAMVKDFELLWITSHLLSVPLMLEYLRIFFPIFFALNKQRKVKEGCVRNWKLYLQVEKY